MKSLPDVIKEQTQSLKTKVLYAVTSIGELESQINQFEDSVKLSLASSGVQFKLKKVEDEEETEVQNKRTKQIKELIESSLSTIERSFERKMR